jgi:hypothetical protein
VKVNNVLAGIAVADVDTAADWYTRLFGRGPDAHPMPGLVEWHFPRGQLQVAAPERAGSSLLTLDVGDLIHEVDQLRARGITAGRVDTTTSEFVMFASLTDHEGTMITLVQARND